MAATVRSNKRASKRDSRAIEFSRWFGSSIVHRHRHRRQQQQQQQQQQQNDEDDDSLLEWTSHAWSLDELVRLYSKKLPVIVRSTRGYYGQPGTIHLEVGQVCDNFICYTFVAKCVTA